MKRHIFIFSYFLFIISVSGQAQNDSVRADFFRDFYHQGHLVHWLDAMSDRTVYQGLHVGQWDESGQLMFSVDGNSYRWNRFYIDGVRVDNRFTPGSTSYVPNMEKKPPAGRDLSLPFPGSGPWTENALPKTGPHRPVSA